MSDIKRLVASSAPVLDPPPALTAGARELLTEITALPVPRRPHRRLLLPLLAGLTAVATLVSWLLSSVIGGPADASALDIHRSGGFYDVTVKQLFAEPQQYQKELRHRGLPIELRVVPVSPSAVGMVFPFEKSYNGLSEEQISRRNDLIQPITRPGSCFIECTIGIRIPVGLREQARIELGRPGRPGEKLIGFGRLDNPGEPLQCVPFVNHRVGEVRTLLAQRRLSVVRYAIPLKGSRTSVPDSWYVQDGWLVETDKVLLVAASTPVAQTAPTPHDCRRT